MYGLLKLPSVFVPLLSSLLLWLLQLLAGSSCRRCCGGACCKCTRGAAGAGAGACEVRLCAIRGTSAICLRWRQRRCFSVESHTQCLAAAVPDRSVCAGERLGQLARSCSCTCTNTAAPPSSFMAFTCCMLAGKRQTARLPLCAARQLLGRSGWQRSTPAAWQRCRASWMRAALLHATLTQRCQQLVRRSHASPSRCAEQIACILDVCAPAEKWHASGHAHTC